MGRQRGGVHISGRVGDVQYYLDRSQGYVRESNPVSKDRILKDPAFVQVRKSMAEFTASSLATTNLQLSLGDNWKPFGERYLRARLGTLTREIVKLGSGLKGKRRFEVGPNLSALEKVDLNEDQKFASSFRAEHTVTVNPDRNTATLDVLAFHTGNRLSVPGNATHFHVFLTVGVLTDYIHVGGKKVYKSTQPGLSGLTATQYSAAMVCDGSMNPGFQVVASLPTLPILPSDACLIVSMGIEFMEIVNSVEEIFTTGSAMQIRGAY